jgi:uncharacterized integral membrane protein
MKVKIYIALSLLGLVLLFVLQNMQVVSIRFLFWQFSLSRALLVLVIFLLGLLSGYLATSFTRNSPRKGASK